MAPYLLQLLNHHLSTMYYELKIILPSCQKLNICTYHILSRLSLSIFSSKGLELNGMLHHSRNMVFASAMTEPSLAMRRQKVVYSAEGFSLQKFATATAAGNRPLAKEPCKTWRQAFRRQPRNCIREAASRSHFANENVETGQQALVDLYHQSILKRVQHGGAAPTTASSPLSRAVGGIAARVAAVVVGSGANGPAAA